MPQRKFNSLSQLVLAALQSGGWWTLAQLKSATGGTAQETSISATLRHLRKVEWGSHRVEKRRLNGGEWEYALHN